MRMRKRKRRSSNVGKSFCCAAKCGEDMSLFGFHAVVKHAEVVQNRGPARHLRPKSRNLVSSGVRARLLMIRLPIYSFTSGLESSSGRKTWLILTRWTVIRTASSTAHHHLHSRRLQPEHLQDLIQPSHTIKMQISALILLFTATASVSAWVSTSPYHPHTHHLHLRLPD